jgi:type III pantothenate kinase
MGFLLAVSVGNTRTAVGHFHNEQLQAVEYLPTQDTQGIVAAASQQWAHAADYDDNEVVVAGVNAEACTRLEVALAATLNTGVWRVGRDLEVPIGLRVDPGTKTGQDRLLCAAAAFDILKQAAIVVDAGTCITVDFVDGEGTFHGGAILPGARMQLAAMHQGTAALPAVDFKLPDADETYGRNTEQAMLLGVYEGIRGAVQRLTERYAEAYGAFPLVIATGGDAPLLFENDAVVSRVVPDLVLRGILVAVRYERGAASE